MTEGCGTIQVVSGKVAMDNSQCDKPGRGVLKPCNVVPGCERYLYDEDRFAPSKVRLNLIIFQRSGED